MRIKDNSCLVPVLHRICSILLIAWLYISVSRTFAAENENAIYNLDVANGKWSVSADNGTKTSLRDNGSSCRATVDADGGAESFPRIEYRFRSAMDFRRYDTVNFDIKIESSEDSPMPNGKEIAVCFYDSTFLLSGFEKEPVQQIVGRSRIKCDGTWQRVSIKMDKARRAALTGIDIYLYEAPYNFRHHFECEIANFVLSGPKGIIFDGAAYPTEVLTAGSKGLNKIAALSTNDGLSLAVGSDGSVFISCDEVSIGEPEDRLTGIFVKDWNNNQPPAMIGGAVAKAGNGVSQKSEVMEMKIDASYSVVANDKIVIDAKIESLSAKDRILTVYFGIPLKNSNWKWGQSFTDSVFVFRNGEKSGFEEIMRDYPFCSLSTEDVGISMSVGIDSPVNCRFIANPQLGIASVAFDFAFVNSSDSPKNAANFSLSLRRIDPKWGFRSACEKYYKEYSKYFKSENRYGGGGWDVPFYRRKAKESKQEILRAGYRYNWDVRDSSDEEIKWNHDNNIANLLYIEPEFLQFSMGDYKSPSYDETFARLTKLSSGEQPEWDRFLSLHYSKAWCCHPHSEGSDIGEFLDELLESGASSGMFNKSGQMELGIAYRPGWIGDSGYGAMIPCNLCPNIPKGKGSFNIDRCIVPVIDELENRTGVPVDGLSLDCLMDVPDDYRRSNFRYSAFPLSFERDVLLPCVKKGNGTIEWLSKLQDTCRDRGMIIMGNMFNLNYFAAPYIDVFGIEAPSVSNPQLLRFMARHRVVTYLPYSNRGRKDVEYHILWGIYPGRGIANEVLSQIVPVLDKIHYAGWEPVTLARSSHPEINIERYGDTASESYLVIHNPTRKMLDCEIRLDAKWLEHGNLLVSEIYPGNGEAISVKNGGFNVKISEHETIVISLKTSPRNIFF